MKMIQIKINDIYVNKFKLKIHLCALRFNIGGVIFRSMTTTNLKKFYSLLLKKYTQQQEFIKN